jgi:tetratricopeptide (TPR) repeat protein
MNDKENNIMNRSREYFYKGYLCQMRGEYDNAISNYEKSIDVYPTAEAFTFLGWTYSYKGDLERAIEECKNAINIDPDYGNPYNDIGAYLLQQGNADEAITWFELAIKSKRYENAEFAHLNLGKALEMKGLWFEALDEYGTALEIAPNYTESKIHVNRLQGKLN